METENFNYQTKCLRYFCVCLATDKLRDQIINSYRFPVALKYIFLKSQMLVDEKKDISLFKNGIFNTDI